MFSISKMENCQPRLQNAPQLEDLFRSPVFHLFMTAAWCCCDANRKGTSPAHPNKDSCEWPVLELPNVPPCNKKSLIPGYQSPGEHRAFFRHCVYNIFWNATYFRKFDLALPREAWRVLDLWPPYDDCCIPHSRHLVLPPTLPSHMVSGLQDSYASKVTVLGSSSS